MIERTVLDTIKETAEMLLEKLEIKAAVKALEAEEESVRVEVEMEDPQLLIGEQGQTLLEVQHVLRLIVRKKLEEAPLITLDINEYRKSRETYLRELAHTTAEPRQENRSHGACGAPRRILREHRGGARAEDRGKD